MAVTKYKRRKQLGIVISIRSLGIFFIEESDYLERNVLFSSTTIHSCRSFNVVSYRWSRLMTRYWQTRFKRDVTNATQCNANHEIRH